VSSQASRPSRVLAFDPFAEWVLAAATSGTNTRILSRIDAPSSSTLRPSEPLAGRFVQVEPLAAHHREGLRAAAAEDPGIFRFMVYPGEFDRWFDEALAAPVDVPFAVVFAGAEAGSTRYMNHEARHRRAEIGWTWLRPSAWGTGANVETKLLLLEHAFERCGLQRVEFKTDARNERTRGALLALGAQFEGIFRKHMVLPSGPRDSAWYAITEDDWPEVKARLLWRLQSRE
jgi:RimJ/RimL family protein N-acetyltransferase